MRPRNWV